MDILTILVTLLVYLPASWQQEVRGKSNMSSRSSAEQTLSNINCVKIFDKGVWNYTVGNATNSFTIGDVQALFIQSC